MDLTGKGPLLSPLAGMQYLWSHSLFHPPGQQPNAVVNCLNRHSHLLSDHPCYLHTKVSWFTDDSGESH